MIAVLRALLAKPAPVQAPLEDPFTKGVFTYTPVTTQAPKLVVPEHERMTLDVPADLLQSVQAELRHNGHWVMQSTPSTVLDDRSNLHVAGYTLTVMVDGL